MMGLHLVASSADGSEGGGGGGGAARLADVERMLAGSRERLGGLADRLAELRRRWPDAGDEGGRAGEHGPGAAGGDRSDRR